ncbi:hypothetical protein ACJX0J_013712, partial [Zea mays]
FLGANTFLTDGFHWDVTSICDEEQDAYTNIPSGEEDRHASLRDETQDTQFYRKMICMTEFYFYKKCLYYV